MIRKLAEGQTGTVRSPEGTSRERLRVLYLTHHLPYPPISGGRRREFELIRRIADVASLHIVAISKTFMEDQAASLDLRPICEAVEVMQANPMSPNGNCSLVARHRCAHAAERIAQLLASNSFDLLHVEGFYLLQHVPSSTPVPVLLVEHNVEYRLWEQRARLTQEARSARLIWEESQRMRNQELEAWRRADTIVAVTEEERQAIAQESGREVVLIPDGADHLGPNPTARVNGNASHSGNGGKSRDERPSLVMVANFGYAPNLDAARWLTEEIMPLIRARQPDAQLLLVGDPAGSSLEQIARRGGVTATGRVPDVAPFLDAADLVVCPLRIGGGVKVKMLEALSRGKAIVTTGVGAQGLDHTASSAFRISDEADAFAASVVELLRHPDRRRRLEARARAAAGRLPSWERAAADLIDLYRTVSTGGTVLVPQPTEAVVDPIGETVGVDPARDEKAASA